MTRGFYILVFIFYVCNGQAQDSLRRSRLKLFDISVCGSTGIYQQSRVDRDYVDKFMQDKSTISSDPRYVRSSASAANYDSSVEGAVGFTFKINTANKIVSRIKPRLNFTYSQREFFRYAEKFSHSQAIDTLHFTDPNVPPVLIDSTYRGLKKYSYSTETFFVEAGFNLDVIRFRHFNFYAGIIYSQGFSICNRFHKDERERFSIEKYPNEINGREKVVLENQVYETTRGGSSSRISLPFGVQHRFSNRKKFSIGTFLEGRVLYEVYKVNKNITVSKTGFMILAGVRFNFLPHF